MKTVYVLLGHLKREGDDVLGVYSSKKRAEQAEVIYTKTCYAYSYFSVIEKLLDD